MNQTTVSGDIIEIFMRQLGASDVKTVTSTLYYIEFVLDSGYEVSYVYNVNFKDQFFLQRTKPYPLPHGTFSNEEDIIDFITEDIHRFQNADKSRNFPLYIELADRMHRMREEAETMFLNCNVDGEHMKLLNKEMQDVLDQIAKIQAESRKV